MDISGAPADLAIRDQCLIIQQGDTQPRGIPLGELAVLLLAHPAVRLTQPTLSGIADHGGVVISCDRAGLPVGMTLPLCAHHSQAERFTVQAAASKPTRKRLWQQIVRAKIRGQAQLLTELHGEDAGLGELVKRVRSGDPDNVEARASRRYWPLLFDDDQFRRRREAADQNRLLNYGYAILRAATARAICAAGLHPTLGFHHHNRSNPFCLADDLMEPFRAVVDSVVVRLTIERGPDAPLTPETKQTLIETLLGPYERGAENRKLFDTLARSGMSLAEVFLGQRAELELPDTLPLCQDAG